MPEMRRADVLDPEGRPPPLHAVQIRLETGTITAAPHRAAVAEHPAVVRARRAEANATLGRRAVEDRAHAPEPAVKPRLAMLGLYAAHGRVGADATFSDS